MSRDETMKSILDFLQELQIEAVEIGPDTEVLSTGYLDSLGIISLVSYFDSEFGIELSEMDFVADNFKSPRVIVELVERISDSKQG